MSGRHGHTHEHGDEPRAHADRLLDANLTRFARAASGEPGAARLNNDELAAIKHAARAQWANGAANRQTGSEAGRDRWSIDTHRHDADGFGRVRGRGFWTGFTAAAATLAIGAVLFTTSAPSSRVNAASILSSLRARLISGADIEFKSFDAGDVTLNGRVQARLPKPVDAGLILQPHEQGLVPPVPPTLEDLSVAGRIDVAIDEQPARGMVFSVDLGFSPQSRWVYLRTLADQPSSTGGTRAKGPKGPGGPGGGAGQRSISGPAGFEALGLAVVQTLLRNGVMVDLSDLDLAQFSEAPGQHDETTEPGAAEATTTDGAHEPGRVRVGLTPKGLAISATPPGGTNASKNGAAASPMSPLDDLARGAAGLLSGRADAEQIRALQQALERAGKQATVEDLGGGQYVLHARTGETEVGGIGGVRVEYQKDAGVERVEFFSNRADGGGGSIVVTLPATPLDGTLLESSRVVQPGAMVIDSRMLRQWLAAE